MSDQPSLKQLTAELCDELHVFAAYHPDAKEDTIDEFIFDAADYLTPIAYGRALSMAASNPNIACRRVDPRALDYVTPANVARHAIHEYLRKAQWDEWRRIQEENELDTALQEHRDNRPCPALSD